ncbi:hypothetical protein NPIL_653061 [Nephila pilipes]|uniref:Uncharacterized protein n=1 Tax=Nephila pilipes TaxID=299642 RepID=A0A8X6T9Y2_NEPPI|nr:hypothetical protein NPIL_653061 [Nephila pilipes]
MKDDDDSELITPPKRYPTKKIIIGVPEAIKIKNKFQSFSKNEEEKKDEESQIATRSYDISSAQNPITQDCHIQERIQDPYCINCNEHGYLARNHKCPCFPKPSENIRNQEPSQANSIKLRSFLHRRSKSRHFSPLEGATCRL